MLFSPSVYSVGNLMVFCLPPDSYLDVNWSIYGSPQDSSMERQRRGGQPATEHARRRVWRQLPGQGHGYEPAVPRYSQQQRRGGAPADSGQGWREHAAYGQKQKYRDSSHQVSLVTANIIIIIIIIYHIHKAPLSCKVHVQRCCTDNTI